MRVESNSAAPEVRADTADDRLRARGFGRMREEARERVRGGRVGVERCGVEVETWTWRGSGSPVTWSSL
jgi:hypothetical protein